MNNLIALFPQPLHQEVVDAFYKNQHITVSGAGNFSSKTFLLADIFRGEHTARARRPNEGVRNQDDRARDELYKKSSTPFPILWAVNDRTEQENTARACEHWMGASPLHFEMLENEGQNGDVAEQNKINILRIIRCFLRKERRFVIAPYLYIMQETPDPAALKKNIFTVKKEQEISQISVFEKLISLGYVVSKDQYLERGEYRGEGGILYVFPANEDHPIRVEFSFDKIYEIALYSQEEGEVIDTLEKAEIYPLNLPFEKHSLLEYLPDESLFIEDELEIYDEFMDQWDGLVKTKNDNVRTITFTSFPEDTDNHIALRYFSVLKYQDFLDLGGDVKEKAMTGWRMMFFTKHKEEAVAVFHDRKIRFSEGKEPFSDDIPLRVLEAPKDDTLPFAFQNPELKIIAISDREIANVKEGGKSKLSQKVYWDFLTQLKPDDLVVHIDHGIARFEGLDRRTVDNVTREYLKLGYAENDKLFVPIDQADKINKFIGDEEEAPHLTRLGSAEWATIKKRVKKETEIIARELLELYAKRKQAKGFAFQPDNDLQATFDKTFPYEETPGQIKAIMDTKKDMENPTPMDRLICGDVGFGKTEVALRAAFKAVQNKKQVALVSPITILADQHYHTFLKRVEPFHIRVEMLSRFRGRKEQQIILEKLGKGEIDIIIGTHRLLQSDVKFKDLGLVIVDEEQRFGVKQKEKFKKLRTEVDIVTLTATPIPRTLNICLNKLRDITTIMTPPPGRLPVITEVRRYSLELIREAILRELKRAGQIYFLHNRVQTIDGIAERLKALVPEARFGVAHGKLMSKELEQRILDFKDHKFDALVASAIIENGIDLPNANTLIVNNAEKFGLAQLYQLRGRVGRGKAQAYAYFLYNAQRLRLDAKKRLRAIVEASELGSGFQIAMKDLEIRGAGDILGVKQHGVINVVGVSHFIRMLNRAVEDLQSGKLSEETEELQEVAIELPIPAYIPDDYIANSKEKINVYQRMSAADNVEYLDELRNDVLEDYGKLPLEVINLFRIIELKIYAKQAGLTLIKAENVHLKKTKQIVLYMGKNVKPENIVHVLEYNGTWTISSNRLRIDIANLGLQWLDELRECVKKLAEKIEMPGKSKKSEPVT